MNASQIVEAVLFASDAPLAPDEIARADESLDEDRVEAAIRELRTEYDETDRAFHVAELGGGFQILTRPEFSTYLERFDTVPRSPRLSGPALEALSIVAYRQPISRVEVEYIRGVSSSGVLRTLQDRDLIDVVGRDDGIGRPYLYGTTQEFLNHFGFRSLEELPRRDELPVVLRDNPPLEEPDEDGRVREGGEADGATVEAGDEEGAGDEGSDEAEEDDLGVEEAVERVLAGLPGDVEEGDVDDGDADGPPPRSDFRPPGDDEEDDGEEADRRE